MDASQRNRRRYAIAGRWKSSQMPAYYAKAELAAVALSQDSKTESDNLNFHIVPTHR